MDYSYVFLHKGSSVYSEVSAQLSRRRHWRRLMGRPKDGVDLILAPAHGRSVAWGKLRAGQAVNYLPGSSVICSKSGLVRVLRENGRFELPPWAPKTFILSCRNDAYWAGVQQEEGPSGGAKGSTTVFDCLHAAVVVCDDEAERTALAAEFERDRNACWILKTARTGRGRNIVVLDDIAAILAHVDSTPCQAQEHVEWVVQRYLERPLLIEGFKFDVRVWVLVDSRGTWFYREGCARLSSERYSMDDITQILVHVTNCSVQQGGENFGNYVKDNQMNFDQLRAVLEESRGMDEGGFESVILAPMKECVVRTVRAAHDELFNNESPTEGTSLFQLFGFDFLILDNLEISLLEVNSAPASSVHLKRAMARDVIDVAIDSVFPPPVPTEGREEDGLTPANSFELIDSFT